MNMNKIIGRIVCPHCGPQETLGIIKGEPVTVSIGLFDVVGRDEQGLWILDCPKQHHVLKLGWFSAQEWLKGMDNSGAHFPAL